jgi:ribosomal-protein-alanine N-acetyltransferase
MMDTIETVSAHDAAWLSDVHASAFPPAERWSADVVALQLGLPNVFGLCDSRGGMILMRVAADEAEVLTLAVSPTVRRKGVAHRLLHAAMRQVIANGVRRIFLEVAVTNRPARALYEQSGFQRVGQRRRYYADGTDALVLCVDLDAEADE